MITKLIIENFKAIERLELELGPFTVLIGPNDAGKSTILQALEIVSRCTAMPLAEALVEPVENLIRRGSGASSFAIAVHGLIGDRDYRYRMEAGRLFVDERLEPVPIGFVSSGHGVSPLTDPNRFGSFRAELSSFLARFDPRQLTAPAKLDTPLASDGSGFAALVDAMLTGANVEPREQIESALHGFAPYVKAIGTEVSADKTGKQLTFLLANPKSVLPGRQMSDGVVLATALLALRYATSYMRYLVEEPENGVHPRMLGPIIEALREIATVRRSQLVVTTHSPLLLDHVDPEDVYVITRMDTNVRATKMTATKFFDERSAEWSLGELWYNIGERELVP